MQDISKYFCQLQHRLNVILLQTVVIKLIKFYLIVLSCELAYCLGLGSDMDLDQVSNGYHHERHFLMTNLGNLSHHFLSQLFLWYDYNKLYLINIENKQLYNSSLQSQLKGFKKRLGRQFYIQSVALSSKNTT